MNGDFMPGRWLRNPHLQAIFASFGPRRSLVLRRARVLVRNSRSVVLDCGEGVRLQGYYTPARDAGSPPRIVVLIHGWEGSASSTYQLSAAARLHARGFDVFRLNLRDHGASHHLNVEVFHSCRLDEVVGAVQEIAGRFPRHALYLAGFSLGGNFALRVAARAREANLQIERVVAVCPVLDPAHTLEALESGWMGYRLHFLRKWKRSLKLKQACHAGIYDFSELLALRSLTEMTAYLVRHHSEFPDLAAYLNGYSIVDGALAKLAVPSHVILAIDDPVIPITDVDRLKAPACLTVETTTFGGHCGFLQGFGITSWIDDWIYDALIFGSAAPAVRMSSSQVA